MAVRYSTGYHNATLGEQGVEAGANGTKGVLKNCRIGLYTTSQPSSANLAKRGTFLGWISDDATTPVPGSATGGLQFDPPVDGKLPKKASQVWKFKAVEAGTIGWARIEANPADAGADSTTAVRVDFSVGVSSGDFQLPNGRLTVAVGDEITIDTFELAGVNPL